MRYRFYREHKYLIFLLFELERLIAKADFRKDAEFLHIQQQLNQFEEILKAHAEHEENALHELLRNKQATTHEALEMHHQTHALQFSQFAKMLQEIFIANESSKISLGNDFYLQYRLFIIDLLQHFHEEETLIMTELHKHYSDEELKKIDHQTYQQMTSDEMLEMMQVLTPHINNSDVDFFLTDMQEALSNKIA